MGITDKESLAHYGTGKTHWDHAAKAIAELGRIPKTLYLLTYIDDETYRRRILTQINRHEDRHQLSRTTFYGQRGEIRKRYREGQEDQLSALGLVVNAIVLWNTLYMEEALKELRTEGFEVKDEDVQRLWPLSYKHINFLGRYHFTLPEIVANGQLRPFLPVTCLRAARTGRRRQTGRKPEESDL